MFAGGFDLAAAQVVAAPDETSRATLLDRLGELVEHRLLRREVNEARGDGRSLRFTLHEIVREHAAAECPAELRAELGDWGDANQQLIQIADLADHYDHT